MCSRNEENNVIKNLRGGVGGESLFNPQDLSPSSQKATFAYK